MNVARNVCSAARKPVLFLVGAPRSGTTWLQKMLGSHPRIGTSQESHLFNHFLAPVFERWEHFLAFDDRRGGLGLPAYLTEEEFHELIADLVHGVLSRAPDYPACDLFVEKTPDHILEMRRIARVMPRARFLVLAREPADVVESLLAASRDWGGSWAPRSTLGAARRVRRYTRAGLDALRTLPQSRWSVVRYEALVADPRAELARILDFAQVDCTRSDLDRMVLARLPFRRHGEFARRGSDTVCEPPGFRRVKKGRLCVLQRLLVDRICARQHRLLAAHA